MPSSSRSKTSRWSAGSPSGHSERKSSKRSWRQTNPLDSRIDPPGAVALLEHEHVRAELAGTRRRAQARHAGTGDDEVRQLDEGEAGLVLHVLHLDGIGAPDEDRERVLGVLDLGDLDPALLGLGLHRVRRVHEQR